MLMENNEIVEDASKEILTNREMIEKAAKEIYNAKTPEQVELFSKLITYQLMG
jgi:hypothetical protein